MPVETRPPRVLIVDDDDLIRALLTTLLKHLGAEVVGEATNGNEAIAAYQADKPDLTFLDIEMPEKNGLEALKEIKKIDAEADVVMLTASDNTSVAESCKHAGARTYIKKGETPVALNALLKEQLDLVVLR